MQQSLGQDHIRTSDFYLLVGKNLLALNRVADAELPLRRCFSIREKATDAETVRAEARYFLGQALARLGSYSEALNLNVVGLELIERAAKRSEARVAYNLHAIGVILIALGRSEEAVAYLERALSRAASNPSTARASVRARIIMSGSTRASTADLSLLTISSLEITSLPSKWPQRFG